jgi:AbrB family looped-hinge helix DNA binding protein
LSRRDGGLKRAAESPDGRPTGQDLPWCNIPTKILLTYFFYNVILHIMNPTPKTDTVMFTVKGQVVIPRWLRKDFEINEGTRAVVYKHNDHIVLKPLTAQHYRRLRGSLKGTKAMDVFMSERKREREL